MKKLLLGICYTLITQIVLSQSLSGTIIDGATGKPIPSATVELDRIGSTVTDDKGQFGFTKLENKAHILKISSIGYQSVEKSVEPSETSLEIRLQSWGLFMQPVEVRAIRASDRAPFAKTNISKAEIQKLNLGRDLPFLLNQTPSVVINSDAGNGIGYTAMRIRGTDATRTNMTINGIPYNDAESQGLFFVNLPDLASSVNSIQIQRGVGTSSNGAGAFGASINFSTNETNLLPYAEINNSYGSFNTWKHTAKAGTGLLGDHFTLDARISSIKSDGFVDRASTDLSSAYLSANWLNQNTSIRFNFITGKERTYQSWNGIPESMLESNRKFNSAGTERAGSPYDNETDNYNQNHYQFFINHQFNSSLTFNTALFLTRGKGYYEQYKADEDYADYGLADFIMGNDTSSSTDLIRKLWLDNYYYGQIFSLQYKGKSTQLTFGGGWNRYDGNHYGEIVWAAAGVPNNYRWYDHEAYKTDINIYSKFQQRIGKRLEVFADLQFRRILYNVDGFRDNPGLNVREFYNFFNPKFGLSYNINGYNLYGSYAIGQKEPNRDDFEAGSQQQPTREFLQDVEIGVDKKESNYQWTANLFFMDYKDQLVLTGKINDVGAYTRINIPKSYRAGIEVSAQVRVNRWLNVGGNFTASLNKIKDFTEYYDDYDNGGQKSVDRGTTDIAFSPAYVGSMVINIEPIKNVSISLPGKYVSRQYLDNTSTLTRSLDAFFVQDVMLSYRLQKLLFKETNLVLQINNVFDTDYEPNGYTFSYQYGGALVTENFFFPMAGRNFMVGLNVKL
ncbi:MAG: TonB-dependent receptor [Chitinophagaceae bacterium]|nr:TonB-dependent receptor [Chitinophagaceae bacterium]